MPRPRSSSSPSRFASTRARPRPRASLRARQSRRALSSRRPRPFAEGGRVSAVLRHVVESITPASRAHRAAAEERLRPRGPLFDRLGGQLAAAQHGAPHARRRALVIAAGDHGAGDPGLSLGAEHPTVVAARAIDDGTAAVRQLARAARAEVLLLDCGTAEAAHLPAGAVTVGRRPSGDARRAAALTPLEVTAALEAGIAVALSLLDGRGEEEASAAAPGLDVLGLGALGLGSELCAAALVAAFLGPERLPLAELDEDQRQLAALAAAPPYREPLAALAAFAGPETCVLTGLLLAAAAMNVPVILDGEATGAAALAAARLAPAAAGYCIASQHGRGCMPAIVSALGLEPVFAGGVGHGEGAAAAMVMGLLDSILEPIGDSGPR